jgi:adenylate cyclase
VQIGLVIAVCVALILWRLGHHSPAVARVSVLAVPGFDMPLTCLIQWLGMTGQTADRAIANWTLAAFVCLLMMSALSLGRLQLIVSGVLAAVGTLFLQMQAQESLLGMAGGIVLLTFSLVVTFSQQRIRIEMLRQVCIEQERQQKLGRYFSPEVARQITSAQEGLAIGQTRFLTVLFTDLRNFTAMSEGLAASKVVPLLNVYFEEMVGVVFKHGGTLDKYLGDGLMIYFGAPIPQADHALCAVKCAQEMLSQLEVLNVRNAASGLPSLQMGAGIHTGEAVVGTMGASHRQDYTAIGATVNLAARLEQLTKDYSADILLSEATARALDGRLALKEVGTATPKGVQEPVKIFTPMAASE